MSILKVEEAVTALAASALLEILEEGIVRGVARSDNLDVDLLLVLDVENYVSMLLVLLDFLVRRLTNVGHGHTGCLKHKSYNVIQRIQNQYLFFEKSTDESRGLRVRIFVCV